MIKRGRNEAGIGRPRHDRPYGVAQFNRDYLAIVAGGAKLPKPRHDGA